MCASFDLTRIIDPTPPTTFYAQNWGKLPLAIQRKDPDFFAALFTLHDLDRLLQTSTIRHPDIRILRTGNEIPLSNVLASTGGSQQLAVEAVFQHYRDGCTISFVYLHERWATLKELCRRLGENLSATVQTNAYLTPPNSQGFNTHYDDHDVFVLQVSGTKRWRVFEPSYQLPLVGQHSFCDPALRSLVCELTLRPGDTLYIPRGFMHDAVTDKGLSLHLTVGVHPVLWSDVLLTALKSLIAESSELRASLPPGFATIETEFQRALEFLLKNASEWHEKQDLVAALEQARDSVMSGGPPRLGGHLVDLSLLDSISATTIFYRRVDVPFKIDLTDDEIVLQFHGKRLKCPGYLADDLTFISRARAFTYLDLPGQLDNASRLTLLKRLTSEGFLTLGSGK